MTQSRSGCCGDDKHHLNLPGIETRPLVRLARKDYVGLHVKRPIFFPQNRNVSTNFMQICSAAVELLPAERQTRPAKLEALLLKLFAVDAPG